MTATIDHVLRTKLKADAERIKSALRHKRYQRADEVIKLQNIDLAIASEERELRAIEKALA